MAVRDSGAKNVTASSRRWILPTIGLGLFAILIILLGLFFWEPSYVLPTMVIAILGLVFAAVGLISWVRNRWVRGAVTAKRLVGEAAWPVRAESKAGRWIRVGVLEADARGITLTIRNGTRVEAGWSEFEVMGLRPATFFARPRVLVLQGPRSGSLDLELLHDDAITREDDAAVQAWSEDLEDLRARQDPQTRRDA